jgi:long-subunit acyl-CoA synthetase (AMP-forming)
MPKGALLTHGNVLSFVAGIEYNGEFKSGPVFNQDDVHLSFLPLAHVQYWFI